MVGILCVVQVTYMYIKVGILCVVQVTYLYIMVGTLCVAYLYIMVNCVLFK